MINLFLIIILQVSKNKTIILKKQISFEKYISTEKQTDYDKILTLRTLNVMINDSLPIFEFLVNSNYFINILKNEVNQQGKKVIKVEIFKIIKSLVFKNSKFINEILFNNKIIQDVVSSLVFLKDNSAIEIIIEFLYESILFNIEKNDGLGHTILIRLKNIGLYDILKSLKKNIREKENYIITQIFFY